MRQVSISFMYTVPSNESLLTFNYNDKQFAVYFEYSNLDKILMINIIQIITCLRK